MTKATEVAGNERRAIGLHAQGHPLEHLFRLRIQAQTERLDAPSELRKHRRLIALLKTSSRRTIAAAADQLRPSSVLAVR